MTFLELIQTCKDEYGKDKGEWVSRYKRLLNRGQRHIANAKLWPFMIDFANTTNTSSGTAEYTLTETNIKKLLNLRISTDGSEKRLSPVSYNGFTHSYPHVDSTETGCPDVYYPTGRSSTYQLKVTLFPVPDATYSLLYDFYKEPTDMSDDADVPVFPTAYHDMLVDYVLWKSYQHDRDMETAGIYKAQFDQNLNQMKGDYQMNESVELTGIAYDGEETE